MAFARVQFMDWQMTGTPEGVIGLNSSNIGVYPSEELARDPGALAHGGFEVTRYGFLELRRRVAELYGVSVDEVLLTAATSMANFLALAASVPEGSVVALERPTYEPLIRAAEGAHLTPVFFDRPLERGFAPDLDAVEACLKKGARAVMLTDLHNPTGAPLGDDDAQALAALCQRYDARLIIDEVYRDFSNLDAPRSRRALGEPFVTTGSLTKVYGLSYLRVGWVLGPPEVLSRAFSISTVFYPELPAPCQVMAMAALDQRDEIVAWGRAIAEPNRAMVQRFAAVEPRLRGLVPEVGLVYFPVLPEGVDGDAFCDSLLREHGVRVAPGRFFGYPQGFRVGLGCEGDVLRAGLAKIIRQLDALGAG